MKRNKNTPGMQKKNLWSGLEHFPSIRGGHFVKRGRET